ncbi:MAG TPA: helix-turn-helix transcriptional regulator [Thermoleophilaceae bacterium]|nr:helix-turn-helix transcriptional regulator [Thermoleophilaceae bacterium]
MLDELGQRLRRTRLERDLSQAALADEAGVERKAVQRIEAGESVRIVSFVRVLRALGLLDTLDRLVPEPTPSPIELLKLHGRQRQRASGDRGASRPGRPTGGPWRWGDEAPGDGE